MEFEMTKKKICVKKIVSQKEINIEIGDDFVVPDIKPDILKTITSNGTVCIVKNEVTEDKIKLEGNVDVYMIYLADSEVDNMRSLNLNVNLKENIDCIGAKEKMKMKFNAKIKSIECKILNGRKINVKVLIGLNYIVYENEEVEIIDKILNCNNLQERRKKINLASLIGTSSCKTYAKETIKIDSNDEFAEIFDTNIEVINKDNKISYNKVLAKADADIKIVYLTEKNQIKTVNEKIPIMGFIELDNVSENDNCDVFYVIRNIQIKPSKDSDHSIYAEIEFELFCEAYRQDEIELLEDVYCTDSNLMCNYRNINTLNENFKINKTCELKEKINVQEINGGEVCDISLLPIINSKKIVNNKVIYDAELKVSIMSRTNSQSIIELIVKKIPISFTIEDSKIHDYSRIDEEIEIKMNDYEVDENVLSLNADLNFKINVYNNSNLNVIENIVHDNHENENPYSMTIYFVKQGDSLWKIAKKFKSTIEDIVKINGIDNENKIDVGQQLFIPKCVN